MRRLFVTLSIVCFVATAGSFRASSEELSNLQKAFEEAGDNRGQLEAVLSHYELDPEKHAAAVFLIENMSGHSYVTYDLIDSVGQPVDFDVLSYENYETLLEAADSIENARGELDYDKRDTFEDLQTITSEFLIEQIDYAFRAWEEKPWAKAYTFDQFCQYILPYRGSNEPLENWRGFFWDRYAYLPDSMSDPSDPSEAVGRINDDVKTIFTFDPRFYFHPTDQGLEEMLRNGIGRCEDMTNFAIYAMRANGLAVTSDYTPAWANSGNNHAWNAILNRDGKVVPFMGAEANPGSYGLANKLAKVYRKTYAQQPDNLVFQEHKQEKVPRWLGGKNYVDVTADYVEVSNVVIRFEDEIPDSVDIAYLCVFNSGDWQPIHWGRITGDMASFTDMGTGIAYLPALYINEEVVPFGPPFILNGDATINYLLANDDDMTQVQVASTTARKLEVSTDGIAKSSLVPGKEYELFYWKGEWQSAGKKIAGDDPIGFDGVPAGALYWLVADGSDREERIFTFEDGRQVWW